MRSEAKTFLHAQRQGENKSAFPFKKFVRVILIGNFAPFPSQSVHTISPSSVLVTTGICQPSVTRLETYRSIGRTRPRMYFHKWHCLPLPEHQFGATVPAW